MKKMIEITFQFMLDLINAVPGLIIFILVMNVISSLLFGQNG